MAANLGMSALHKKVVIKDQDSASGMALMIHDLLVDNLASFKSKAFISSFLNGSVNLIAEDKKRFISISFSDGLITIQDSISPDSPTLSANWKTFANVSSGLASPVNAYVKGELKIKMNALSFNDLKLVLALGYLLTVPDRFYKDKLIKVSKDDSYTQLKKAIIVLIVVLIMFYVLRLIKQSKSRNSSVINSLGSGNLDIGITQGSI